MDEKAVGNCEVQGPMHRLVWKVFSNIFLTRAYQVSARGSKAHSSLLPLSVRAARDSQTPAFLSLLPSFGGGEMAQTAQ